MTSPGVFWGCVGAALLGLAVFRRRALAEALGGSSPQAKVTRGLVVLSAALLLVRFALARARGVVKNVDEYGYQALADFCLSADVSMFACLPNLRAQHFFLLVPIGDPFAYADLLASAFFAVTAFLLGLTLYRARGRARSALLVPPLFFLGTYSFEGLTANSECFANLFLAAYLLVRLGAQSDRCAPKRSVLAGACLGMAFLFKEQAGAFVLAEALIGAHLLRAEGRLGLRAYVGVEVRAALGFLIPVAAFFAWAAANGQLGVLLDKVSTFVSRGGRPLDPPEAVVVTQRAVSFAVPISQGMATLGIVFLSGLGVLAVLPLLDRGGEEAEEDASRLRVGLCLYLLIGCLPISTGLRFFKHYFLFLMPPLAILGGIGLAQAVDGLRGASPKRRLSAAVLAFAGISSVLHHVSLPRNMPQGFGLEGNHEPIAAAAEHIRSSTAPGATLFVGGWRPELYGMSGRAPASRVVAGGLFELETLMADLRAQPPAAVVFPGKHSVELPTYTFEGGQLLEVKTLHRLKWPPLQEWLEREGYERSFEVEDVVVWLRRGSSRSGHE